MVLRAEKIAKWYYRKTGESNRFFAVNETDFRLEPGTLTVLMGRSGSGKTTLMHILAGLLRPDSGIVLADGQDLYEMSDKTLSRFRNEHIGIVPQGHAAVQSLNVLENVMLPAMMYRQGAKRGLGANGKLQGERSLGADGKLQGERSLGAKRKPQADHGLRADRKMQMDGVSRAEELLERFEIRHLAETFPAELSGGELRRMSVARALAADADILMADEPTGDLDDENTILVMRALREAADQGKAVFVVTHESDALAYADHSYTMSSGTMSDGK